MSQLPHVDPLRPTPLAPSEPRSVSGATPPDGSPSFNDHLERAGRPTDPRPAAATPRNETPARRDAEVDEDRADERSVSNQAQSDAGTAEGSTDERHAVDDQEAHAAAENHAVGVEAEHSGEGDELHLSEAAEVVELQPLADAADTAHAAAVASSEISETDEARSTAAARRRQHSSIVEKPTDPHTPQDALDSDADPADEPGVDVAKGAARLTAAQRGASGHEALAGEGPIARDRPADADKVAPTARDVDASGKADFRDRPALPLLEADDLLDASSSPGGKPSEAAPVTARRQSAINVETQRTDHPPDLSRRPGAPRETAEDAKVSTSTAGSVRRSRGRSISGPVSHRRASKSQSTGAVSSAEPTGASRAEPEAAVESARIDADRPHETSGPQARRSVDAANESDRSAPQRNIDRVGSRFGRTSPPASGGGNIDRARFVTRVAGAFQAAGREGGRIRLRLHPPELGVIRLEVKMEAGTLTARFEVETPSGRTALLDSLPALRDRLIEQGIKIEKFNVDLMDRRSEDTPYGTPGGHDRRQEESSPEGSTSSQRLDPPDSPLEESSPERPAATAGANQLNVVI